jgi:hypothetical protein
MTNSVKNTEQQPDYVSFLLRLWRVTGNERAGDETAEACGTAAEAVWRASVESPLTGKQQGFADLDDLFDFLREQTHRT